MNASTALARAVLGDLVRGGVRELVLCPGSRSAPLAFAGARLADTGALRMHVRIDERSAGFLALGLAKVSGRPVAVVCTSGTAVANLMPAVVEASYAAVRLMVISADRPVETRGVGAPQTIDQIELFGDHVRFFADLGAPASAAEAVAQARPVVRLALRTAAGRSRSGFGTAHCGPVHLNVGFRLPLVPDPPDNPLQTPLMDSRDSFDPIVWSGVHPQPPEVAPAPAAGPGSSLRPPHPDEPGRTDHPQGEDLPQRAEQPDQPTGPGNESAGRPDAGAGHVSDRVPADQPPRGLILVGDLPGTVDDATHQAILRLSSAKGWPIVAEPTANLHGQDTVLGHGVLVLGTAWADERPPDLVLTAGAFGLSRPTLALLRRARTHVAIELPGVGREVCDPVRTAVRVIDAVPSPASDAAPDPQWLAGWLAADRRARAVVDATLARPAGLTGGAAAREVFQSTPPDGLLLLAASWPVRHVEALGGRRSGLRVIGNRGANGIDGLVATAWGAALAHQRSGGDRAIALLGDLAFLHDHNGLLCGPGEERPDLSIVVVDNGGGGIFSQLEQGRPEYAADFERLFATPQGRDLVAVAEAAGVPAERVTTLAALRAALAPEVRGVHVVVAEVRGFSGDLALMDAVDRALRE